jgi:hypothetical protein
MVEWIFGGLFYLFGIFLFHDCREFWISCFVAIDNRITLKPVSKTDWTILKKIVREYQKAGVRTVKSCDFSAKLMEKYLDCKLERVRETVQALRRIAKSEDIATEEVNSSEDLRKKSGENVNSLKAFKEKYRAEQLFQRFVVNDDVDIEKMSILIQKLKRRNRKKRKFQGKIKKAYFLINLVNLKEFEEALRKWRGPEIEEKRILSSLDYE